MGERMEHVEQKMGEFASSHNFLLWLKAKIADFEDRSHRNNVKICGVPKLLLRLRCESMHANLWKNISSPLQTLSFW